MALSNQDPRKPVVKQTEIDFGTTPVGSAEFTISDEDVTPDSRIVAFVAYESPTTGKDADEYTMDNVMLVCAPGTQEFTLFATGMEGYLADVFKITYILG